MTQTASPLFKTTMEAQEVNSLCAFCRKPKFRIVAKSVVNSANFGWRLVRCTSPLCERHCKFDHSGQVTEIQQASEDHLEMTTVYGRH